MSNTCKNCGGNLIVKQTRRTPEQLTKSYYYTAYYFCPNCKKLYHDEKFKVTNEVSHPERSASWRRVEGSLPRRQAGLWLFGIDSSASPQNDNINTVHIWTDGASRNNGADGARAAWAFVAKQSASGRSRTEKAGRVIGIKQTNNVAEALAIYHALLWAAEEKHKKIKIYTDSQITLHGLAKSPQKVKENREIFQLIQDVVAANGLEVDFEKVPGHADNVNNNRADHLANELAGIK